MWHSLGPVPHSALHALIALLRESLVSGPRRYYPNLHAVVARRIKVYRNRLVELCFLSLSVLPEAVRLASAVIFMILTFKLLGSENHSTILFK